VADRTVSARQSLKRLVWPFVVAVVAVGLVLMLFVYTRDDIERDARLRFERQAADALHIIDRRLNSYVGITYGLRALFSARDSVSRSEFHRYVESLDLGRNYPGFEVLNFARHVTSAGKRQFEDEIRRDVSVDPRGYPGFAIKPTGERPEYHVFVYLEPMKGNEFAFGLDIGMSGAPGRAIARQRDTGELFSSGRLLNVGKDKFVGLAMRLAVYRSRAPVNSVEERRAAFIGTVGAGYNVRKLMTGVLADTTMTSMRYRLLDAGPVESRQAAPVKPSLLFDSAQTAPGAPIDDFVLPGAEPMFDAVLPLQLAGRHWELHFSAPKQSFVAPSDARLPWLVLAGGLLSCALLFAVLYAFASSRARAVALAEEMTGELRESEGQVRDLLRRLVSAQEAERRRFSADLHDLVGQSLSVLGMGFETIRALLPGALPKKAEATIDHMGHLLKETMGSVREVMSDLRPPLLDDYGLYAAIEWHAKQLEARTGLRVRVEGHSIEPRPSPDVEVALFRIAQEALTNVAKHAAASQASVSLSSLDGRLTLVIEDNGKGIRTPPAANDPGPAGWGMAVMRERAAAVGGAVRVDSPGRGTRIIVEVASSDQPHPG
jgi:signal transduction histidine kinase